MTLVLVSLAGGAVHAGTPVGYQLDLNVTSASGARHYAVRLLDGTCGGIEVHGDDDRHDDIRLCTRADGAQVRVEVDWSLREGKRALHAKSTTIVARGARFELADGGATLGVAVR